MGNSSSHLNRSLRLQNYDYSEPGYYFVTTCTSGRERLFGVIENERMILNEYGEIVKETIEGLNKSAPGVEVDDWVIMPDHVHLIIVITSLAALVEDQRVSTVREPCPQGDQLKSVGGVHEPRRQVESELQPFTPAQRRLMLLPKIVGRMKMISAKKINRLRQSRGNPVWEVGFYERMIRTQRALDIFREYLLENSRCL